jgi:excisionase family DNA binding protein
MLKVYCIAMQQSTGIRRAEQTGAKMADSNERLNPVEEVSRRLSVSTFTTRRLIKSGYLHAVRVGKRVLVPESEIARVIAEGCGKHAGN